MKPPTSFVNRNPWRICCPSRRAAKPLGIISACAMLSANLTQAADWPQWRGPARDDVSTETGLLKQWPAGGPPLAWKATGLGGGYSGVAVVGNRIYTMGESADSSFHPRAGRDGRKNCLVGQGRQNRRQRGQCLSRAARHAHGGRQPGHRARTMGRLGLRGRRHGQGALASQPGRRVWRENDVPLELRGIAVGGRGEGHLHSRRFARDDAGAQQADRRSDLAQRGLEGQCGLLSPVAAEIGGKRQYIQLTDASVGGISAADGSLLWRAPRKGSVAVIPTPIVAGDYVYVASGYNAGCSLFKVSADGGKFSAGPVYENKVMVNQHGGVVKTGDYVYGFCDSKGWTCQDFKTGAVMWQEKEKLGKGSLTCAGGMLYLRAEAGKGTVVLIEATPKGWTEKGRFDQTDRSDKNSWPHPVVANGRLYLRDQDALLSYDVKQK